MAENQRLRWWQEETSGQAGQSAAERLAPSPAPLLPRETAPPVLLPVQSVVVAEESDTWAEIEAEAVRRAAQANTEGAESVSFYTDKAAALTGYRRYRRLMVLLITVEIAFNLILMGSTLLQWEHVHRLHIQVPWFSFVSTLLILLVTPALPIGLFLYVKQLCDWVQKSDKPAIRLSPQGIQLCTPQYKSVMVPWNEIAAVNRKGSGKYRRLELRSTKMRRFDVYEQYLGASVEVFAAEIAAYKTARGIA